ncbi:MAG: site-2 protease family protein [Candidatus Woesearchaeota archaeon]
MAHDTIALLALLALLGITLFFNRKQLKVHSFLKVFYFCMYRTKVGLKTIECIARRHEKMLKKLGYLMIPVCFIGMLVMIEELLRGIFLIIQKTNAITVGVVLPIQAKGVFYVPFFYWIISIVFIMLVHESSHGIIARAHNVKIKSTGFAFLGAIIPIVPGAFVEIDENHLAKKSKFAQLSVFSAGPFANIVFGLLFWAVFLRMQHLELESVIFKWFLGLVFWLFALNLGVGLFNLIPLGPIDGGRMLHTTLEHFVHHKHAKNVWHMVSIVMLAIIAVTVISAFV